MEELSTLELIKIPTPAESEDKLVIVKDRLQIYFDVWFDEGKYFIDSYAEVPVKAITDAYVVVGPRGGLKSLEIKYTPNNQLHLSKRHKKLISQILKYLLACNIEIGKEIKSDIELKRKQLPDSQVN